ncbi:MAG TPA: hypothetical protein VIT21_04170 [Chthoniobacterales bacterium]
MSEPDHKVTTLEQARAAKMEAHDVFQRLARLTGVGITRIGRGYGLKVNVEAPPADGVALPKVIMGVPVKVEVVGTLRKRAA